MILKFWGRLYNISNDWKKIYLDSEYLYISFPYVINGEDGEGGSYSEPYELSIDLDPNEDSHDIAREHKDYDHKDIRQVRYRADDIIYNMIISEIIRDTQLIDLDKMVDIPKILNKANKQFIKDCDCADDNTD